MALSTTTTTGRLGAGLLTAFTAVYLGVMVGYDASRTIHGFPDLPIRTFRIDVVQDRDELPAEGAQVWIRVLRADGSATKPGAVGVEGNWEVHETSDLSVLRYAHFDGSRPASLSVRGRWIEIDAQLGSETGAIDVSADGEPLGRMLLHAEDERRARRFFPALPVPWIGIGVFLVLFGLLAWWIGPGRPGRTELPWLLLFLSLVHLHDWVSHPVGVSNDSPHYLDSAFEFAWHGRPSYFPIGYGTFLWMCWKLSGLGIGLAHITTFIQHVLAVLSSAWLYLLIRRVVPGPWAFAAGLLSGGLAPVLLGAQALMSESLTTFFLVMGAWLALTRDGRQALLRGVLAGAALGLSTLTRVTPAAVLGPVLVLGALAPWPTRSVRFLVLALGVAAAMLGYVLLSLLVRTGDARLSTSMGQHLFNHFVREQKLLDEEGTVTRAVLSQLAPGTDLTAMQHWELTEALRQEGSPAPAGEVHLRVALEAARTASILEHVWFDVRLAFANAFGNAVKHMEDDYLVAERESPWDYRNLMGNAALPGWSPNPDLRRTMTAVHGWLWWALCVSYLLGIPVIWLLPGTSRPLWIALLYMPMSYVFLASAVEFYLPRYNAAVSPIVAVVAVATVGTAWTRLRRPDAAPGLS